MHVLIIPSWYKNRDNPVAGSFFEEQARGLMHFGCQVAIFYVEFKSFSFKRKCPDKEYLDNGLITKCYSYKSLVPRNHRLNYFWLCIKAHQKFKLYVKNHGKPDVIHAHSTFWGGIIARYISEKSGIPYIITEHLTSFISGEIKHPIDITYAKKVFTDSKINIVVSKLFKKELTAQLQLPENRFVVIHNMVAPLFFKNFSTNTITESQPIRFFTNSFISERKNHLLLLESFAVFLASYPKSLLVIGGDVVRDVDAPYKKQVIERCNELKINKNVVFLGSIDRLKVKQELDNCHIFLLASKYETFGVVLIEALASGRPVITTNSKGPQDIIDKGDGIIVNSWNEQAFAEAMIDMVKNYSSYDQRKISNHCSQRFSEAAIIGQLMDIYKSVN